MKVPPEGTAAIVGQQTFEMCLVWWWKMMAKIEKSLTAYLSIYRSVENRLPSIDEIDRRENESCLCHKSKRETMSIPCWNSKNIQKSKYSSANTATNQFCLWIENGNYKWKTIKRRPNDSYCLIEGADNINITLYSRKTSDVFWSKVYDLDLDSDFPSII